MVLQGEAIIAFESEEVHLNAGDYCNIPAHTKHKVTWTLPECETVWLAVHY
jgi:cupin 2 domain-containing protein